jgi:acid phosphatase
MIGFPRTSKRMRCAALALSALLLLGLTACGSHQSDNSTPPPTSSITAVSASCTPATIGPGGTSQCTAAVQGTGNYSSAVNWSASAGAISASGLFTAPASAATVTITATSVQNTSKSGTASVTVKAPSPPPASKHVVMVMEENQSYSTIVGNSNWPSLNSLIRNGALATMYYANVHPSIGNYFMLTTGQVLTTDDSSTKVWNVANIARSMLAAGVSFRIYAEGIPGPGYLGGNTGAYLIRHQPFAMLSDLADNQELANQHIWPFSQFATDLANGNLPTFSFIVPDVNDDAHNGTPQQADSWLQTKVVSPLSNDSSFQPGGGGVLIVDFDEAVDSDTTHGGGHVPAVFWGPGAKSGYKQQSSTIYQHQSMLRSIMEELNLPNPPAAAATAPSMSEFFVK